MQLWIFNIISIISNDKNNDSFVFVSCVNIEIELHRMRRNKNISNNRITSKIILIHIITLMTFSCTLSRLFYKNRGKISENSDILKVVVYYIHNMIQLVTIHFLTNITVIF